MVSSFFKNLFRRNKNKKNKPAPRRVFPRKFTLALENLEERLAPATIAQWNFATTGIQPQSYNPSPITTPSVISITGTPASAVSETGTLTTATITANNNLVIGDWVVLSGVTSAKYDETIWQVNGLIGTGPNYTGFTINTLTHIGNATALSNATATVAGYTITGISETSGTTATVATSVNNAFTAGEFVTIAGVTDNGSATDYDYTWQIASASGSLFTITTPTNYGTGTASATASALLEGLMPSTVGTGTGYTLGMTGYPITGTTSTSVGDDIASSPSVSPYAISSILENASSTTATVSTTIPNSFYAGESVTISGVTSPSGYNQAYTVQSITPDHLQFTITTASSIGNATLGATPQVAQTTIAENTWRIRGLNNGWSLAAPQDSQGVQLDASTVGFTGINFSFDWYSTTQGVRDLQFQYSLNVNTANPTWVTYGGTTASQTYISPGNDFYADQTSEINVNLSSITGANNDANFGVRLVSAYDSTGGTSQYASAALTDTAISSAVSTVVSGNSSVAVQLGGTTFPTLVNGEQVTITGVEPTAYDGSFTISNVNNTNGTFTYTVNGQTSSGALTVSGGNVFSTVAYNNNSGNWRFDNLTFSGIGNTPPNITSANSTQIYEGTTGSFQVTTSGSPAPTYSLSGLTGTESQWISIGPSSGIISFGTNRPAVTTTTPYTFSVNATNGVGSPPPQPFTVYDLPTISYTSVSNASYMQDFSSLSTSTVARAAGTAGNGSPVDGPYDLTTTNTGAFGATTPAPGLAGWYAENLDVGSALDFASGPAAGTQGALYDFNDGTAGSQSLGTISTTASGARFGAIFVNNTSETFNQFSLSYIGEQWWANTGTGNALNFAYEIGSAPIPQTGTGTQVASLGFTAQDTGSAVPLDAFVNADGMDQVPVNGVANGISWAPGQTLTIFWDKGTTGSSDGLGIANVSFSAQHVNQLPTQITSPDSAYANVGVNGSYQVTTSGFPTPPASGFGFGTGANAPPAWITFSNSTPGLLVFTNPPALPAGMGDQAFTFTITATNGVGSAATQQITVIETLPATPFTAGDLLLLQTGNNNTSDPVYASEAPVSLQEISSTGMLAENVPIPDNTAIGGTGNQPLSLDIGTTSLTNGTGNGTGVGQLERSADSSVVSFAGNDIDLNGDTDKATSDYRTLGVIGVNPSSLDTTTYGLISAGDDLRGAVEVNSSTLYSFGHTTNGGLRYYPGTGNSPTIGTEVDTSATKNNIRDAIVGFNGQVYYSSAKSTIPGVFISETGNGIPVADPTAPGTDTEVIDDNLTGSANPNGMFLADMSGDGLLQTGDRMYVLDSSLGLLVSTYTAPTGGAAYGTWSTLTPVIGGDPVTSSVNYIGLTGEVVSPTEVQLYFTNGDGTGNSSVWSLDDVDTGTSNTGQTANMIAQTSSTNGGMQYNGLSFAPIAATTASNFEINGSSAPASTHPNTSITFSVDLSSPNAPPSGNWPGVVYFVDTNSNTVLNPGGTVIPNDGVVTFTDTSGLSAGQYDVHAYYAGNLKIAAATSASDTLSVTGTQTDNVTLSSSPNSSTYGETVNFVATVTGTSDPGVTPTGSITLYDGATVVGTAQLPNSQNGTAINTVTIPVSTLSINSHQMTIYYSGDNNYMAGTSTPVDTQVVNAGATITVSDGSTNAYGVVAAGTDVPFTATVTGNGTDVPYGSVQFYENNVAFGSPVALTINGNVGTAVSESIPIGEAGVQSGGINGSQLITAVYIPSTSAPIANYAQPAPITNAAYANNVATITASNNFAAGETVTIYGVTSSGSESTSGTQIQNTLGFDGTFVILSATSSSFTYALGSNSAPVNPGTYVSSTGAEASLLSIVPWIETAQQNFAIGDLIVLDRPNQPSNASQLVSLLEYTPASSANGATLVQKVYLPDQSGITPGTSGTGVTNTFGLSGHASTEGALALSGNESSLSAFGFDLPLGTIGATSTSSATHPRTAVSISNSEVIDSSTIVEEPNDDALTNARGAVTNTGSSFYVVGDASGTNTGIAYAKDGSQTANTPLSVNNPPVSIGPNNVGGVGDEILNGQLYVSGSSAAPLAIETDTSSTTSTGAISIGLAQTVTPGSMAGIQVGTLLLVDTGTNQESVVVTATTATTFTATFTDSHNAGTTILVPIPGLPANAGVATLIGLPGLEAAYQSADLASPNPYGFLLFNHATGTSVDPDTLYIADQTYGLLKLSLIGGEWTFEGEKLNNTTSVEGLAGYEILSDPNNGGNPSFQLYATAALNSGNNTNQLLYFDDTGAWNGLITGGLFTVIANATNSTDTFSGLSFAPLYATSTALTSSADPTDVVSPGTPITLTGTVTDTNGTAAPAGTVTFFDGQTALPGTVNYTTNGNGQLVATLTATLAVGSHNITASYNGDAETGLSTSAVRVETVAVPITVTSVTVNGDTAPILSAAELTSGSAAVTVTTDGPSGFLSGQEVSIAGVNVGGNTSNTNGYNGVWAITGVSGDTFTFNSTASGLAAASSGTGTATTDQIPSIAITTATESTSGAGTTATVTTASANGYVAGEAVVIAGVTAGGTTNNAYNGSYSVGTVLSPTSFTYTASAPGLAAGSGGTASRTSANAGLLAGSQRSMVDSIVYKFNQAVTLGSGALTLAITSQTVGGTANATHAPNVIYSTTDGGLTWIATFVTGNGATVSANSIADGVYDITLNNSAIAAAAGGGTLAANRTDTFWRLFGDFTGAAAVNTIDRVRFNAAYASMAGAANFFAAFDDGVNGGGVSGSITNIDRILFNAQSGKQFTGFTATI